MSLQVWLPLNKETIVNKGLTDVSATNMTYVTSGKLGGSYRCNGGRICNWGAGQTSNGISVAFWHKFTNGATSANTSVCDFEYVTDCRFYLYTSEYKFYIGYKLNVAFASVTNDDDWHHIVMSSSEDGTSMSLYIDGNCQASVTGMTTFNLGGNFGFNSNSTISDFRIYDHTLSKKEILELSRGLMLHYKLDSDYIEGTTNVVDDNYTWGSWSSYGFGSKGRKETITDSSCPYNDQVCKVTNSSSANGSTEMARWVYGTSISSGGTASMSCYVKGVGASIGKTAFIHVYNTYSGNTQSDTVATTVLTSEWQRISGVFTWKKSTISSNGYSIYIVCRSLGSGESFLFSNVQFEMKDHSTPFVIGTRESKCYDCSGFENTGDGYGTITTSSGRPIYTKSSVFNGSDSYVLGNFYHGKYTTYNIWVNYTTTNKHVIDCRDENGTGAQPMFLYSNSLQGGGSENGFPTLSAGKTINDGSWHMLTEVYSGSTLQLYTDGKLTSTTAITAYEYGMIPLHLGTRYSAAASECYNGGISDLRIYGTALSADYIKSLYGRKASIDKNGNLFVGELVQKEGAKELMRSLSELKIRDGYTGSSEYTESYVAITGRNWVDYDGEFIEINPSGKTYQYDIMFGNSIEGCELYIGFEIFDSAFTSTSNNSCHYVVDVTNKCDNVRVKGTVDLSTDSDGNPAKYIRLRILTDWYNANTANISTIYRLSLREVTTIDNPDIDKKACLNSESFRNEEGVTRIYKNGFVSANEFYES